MTTAAPTNLSHDLAVQAVRQAAHPLRGATDDYDPLLELIGDARFVLLGEALHGTHVFYRERAQVTKRLIRKQGFNVIAIEADWPDAYRVNRYVRGRGDDAEAIEALAGFRRFPTWMWRNADGLDFVGWLRDHNDAVRPGSPKIGFRTRSRCRGRAEDEGRGDHDHGGHHGHRGDARRGDGQGDAPRRHRSHPRRPRRDADRTRGEARFPADDRRGRER